MLFDVQNRHWTKLLTTDPVSDLNWSHQGDSVYFSTAAFQKPAAVFRTGLDTRKVERITGLDGLQRLTSWWLGLMPDDSPLIQRDVGPQEIYSLDVNFP